MMTAVFYSKAVSIGMIFLFASSSRPLVLATLDQKMVFRLPN